MNHGRVADRIVVQPAGADWVAWSLDVAGVHVRAATEQEARTKAEARTAKQLAHASAPRARGRALLDALAQAGWKPKPRSRGRVLRRGTLELAAPIAADAVLEVELIGSVAERFDVPYARLCGGLGRAREPTRGDVIGDGFRLVELIGKGGHADVWRATRGADDVAVKLLRRERARHLADYVLRFEAEARAMARIESRHVPRVHAAGFDPDAGTPYIAMELVRGTTLDVVRRGGVPLQRALAIGAQIARALADVGAAGVIGGHAHTQNVMLEGDIIKLIDFDGATLQATPCGAVDLHMLARLVRSLVPKDKVPPALHAVLERLARGEPERALAVASELDAIASRAVAPP